MRYFSLFSGIGGFELGAQQAYESNLQLKHIGKKSKSKEYQQRRVRPINKHREVFCSPVRATPLCVGYSEIDKYAIQIYQRHFPTHKNWGDATKIVAEDLPDFDFLIAGFPCQSFSVAGKQGGFKDTRGTLFFEIARIARAKRPPYLLLENVKGLLNHDKGNTFATIISTIDELGYDCQWCVLNSKNFGVPQNRERVFIVGHLRGKPRPKIFPIGESNPNDKKQDSSHREHCISRALTASYGDVSGDGTKIHLPEAQRIYSPNGVAKTIKGGGGQGAKTGLYRMSPTLDANYWKGNSPSHIKNKRTRCVVNGVRRLTPTECERLQGFPDGWTEGVSDTQRYKTLGNAVTVNVVREIMKRLL